MSLLDYCIQKANEIPVETHRQRHYAVVVSRKGQILSEGRNEFRKSHPMQAKYAARVGRHDAIQLHAEISALIRCANLGKAQEAHKIVVVRVDKMGNPVNSCPCTICSLFMKEFGIKSVEFSL